MCYKQAAEICIAMTEHIETAERLTVQAECALNRAVRLANLGRNDESELLFQKAWRLSNCAFGYKVAAYCLMQTLQENF